MADTLFIPIVLGTVRDGRLSEHVANFLQQKLEDHPEIETQVFDPKDFNFPKIGYGGQIKDQFPEYRDAVIKADAFIFISPEYNHGYSGDLKKIIDLMLREYAHKAVGLVGVSKGGFGGTRVIEQLVNVVRELGLVATFSDLNVSKVGEAFDDNGMVIDDRLPDRADRFITELVWMAKTLKWGRKNVPSQYHE